MCEFGNYVILLVPIPANLSYTGQFRWDFKGIDGCIAPIVKALNDAGIYTASSCCGHGKVDGEILLHDGRVVIIKSKVFEATMAEGLKSPLGEPETSRGDAKLRELGLLE